MTQDNKQTIIILVDITQDGYAVKQVAFGTVPADDFDISFGVFRITELDLDKIEDNRFYVKLVINEFDDIWPEITYEKEGDWNLTHFIIDNDTISYAGES